MIKDGCSVVNTPQTTTATCFNQPRAHHLRGFVFVIGIPVEHILGTGANTTCIVYTQVTHS